MARDDVIAALGALSVLSKAASDIHSRNLQVEENARDRKLKRDEARLSREHSEDMQLSAHNQKKERDQLDYNRQMRFEYGAGLEVGEDGNVYLPADYDYTKSHSFIKDETQNLANTLREYNIYDTEDDKDTMNMKSKAYNIGRTYTSGLFGNTLSDNISFMYGGDSSPTMLTGSDFAQFEAFYESQLDADGNLLPLGVQELREMGVLTSDVLIEYDEDNGLPYVPADQMHLVNATIAGMKKGVDQNKSFKTETEFVEWKNSEAAAGLQFATNLSTSAYANEAVKLKTDLKVGIADALGFKQDAEKMIIYMNWGGAQGVRYTKVINEIIPQKLSTIGQNRRANVVELVSHLSSTGEGGSGLEAVILYLNSMSSKDRKFVLADFKAAGGGAIADQLSHLVDVDSQVDKVVNLTTKYIQDPIKHGQVEGIKKILTDEGLYNDLRMLRNYQSQGESIDENSPNYNKRLAILEKDITNRLTKIANQLASQGKKAESNELLEWMALEQATYQLSMEALRAEKYRR